ncbi:DUF6261 family protein [Parabacteroides sp.]
MARVQTFPKSKLKLAELQAVGHAIENQILSADTDVTVTDFQSQFDEYQSALSVFDSSLLKLKKSNWTNVMKELKAKRTKLRSNAFSNIRSLANCTDEEIKKPAVMLLPLIDRYKYVYQKTFDDQTGHTSKLISEVESDTFKSHVEKLKLTKWFADIKAVNNECAEASSKRKEEQSLRNQPVKTPVSRAAFNRSYEALVIRLNSLAEINGDDSYIGLFSWWNELIDSYRVSISLRSGKGKGGKTDNGSSSKHDPNSGGNINEERPGELQN